MASVFKRTEDKGDRHAPWQISFTDERGRRRTRKAFRDKGESLRLAIQLEDEARRRRMDPRQARLSDSLSQPIGEHLDGFEQHLRDRGNTAKHVKLTMTRVRAVVDGCEFRTLADLIKSRVASWMASQIGPRRKAGEEGPDRIGHKTANHYAQAVEEFTRWLVDDHRLTSNPLAGLPRWNTETDVRHQRRALSAEELSRFLQAARHSTKSVQCFTGEQRYRVYRIACATGLRKSEIASLSPKSFDLDTIPPTVTVEAACSKHRREDIIPLHPDLAAELPEWFQGMEPDTLLFPALERKKTFRMVQADLKTAKIAYQDASGEFMDFHGLRHSFVTNLLRSGASISEARDLARHSDIRMTARYSQLTMSDQAAALANMTLPQAATGVEVDALQATGTEGAQRRRSGTCVPDRPFASLPVPDASGEVCPENDHNPHGDGGYVVVSPEVSVTVPGEQKWRRRESNPRPHSCKQDSPEDLRQLPPTAAAPAQRGLSDDPDLTRIIQAWPHLSPEARQAILSLAASAAQQARQAH